MNEQKNAKAVSVVSAFLVCFIWYFVFKAWVDSNSQSGSYGVVESILFWISTPFIFFNSAKLIYTSLKPKNISPEQEIQVAQDKKDIKIYSFIVFSIPFIIIGVRYLSSFFIR